MAIRYEVRIEAMDTENRFHITWLNPETLQGDSFDQTGQDMTVDDIGCPWHLSPNRLEIGQRLFRFLDGDSRLLRKALDEADNKGEHLHLHLFTCPQTANWPFELLAHEETFLLPFRLHLVRQVSEWGKERRIPPKDRPLKLLFMACSPLDITPELDYEREEDAIFQVTEKLAIDMEIEDSGTLDGLQTRLEREQFDVVHLSGHADIDKKGRPYFLMEDETGKACMIYPEEMWNDALIENSPRLLFLSGCRTGEAPETEAAVSFARVLAAKHHIPAVLGWGRPVADNQAIRAEEMIYKELSRGKTILEAVQRARHELAKEKENETVSNPAWTFLRLFSTGVPLTAIVKPGQQTRPKPRQTVSITLGNSRVQVLSEGFVGRRRQLQQSLNALKNDLAKVGLLLLGTAGLGKSCLAGRISQRCPEYTTIIVQGKLDAVSLQTAMNDAFIKTQDRRGQQLLSRKGKMADKLADLCSTSFQSHNYLLLFDDFQQNLEGAAKGQPGYVMPEAAELLQTLLHFMPNSENSTQLLITSRYDFSLTLQNRDLVEERLEKIWLTSFQYAEIRKKVEGLENIAICLDRERRQRLEEAGGGNPLLMERIDGLGDKIHAAEISDLLGSAYTIKEEFLKHHLLRELLEYGGANLVRLLRWVAIFRRPVEKEGMRLLAEKAGIGDWWDFVKKGMGLGLIEHDRARSAYRVTPLLREHLLAAFKETHVAHQAACSYYKSLSGAGKPFDPVQTEEQVYHALGSGEERTAARQGGMLVQHFRERLAFGEALRIGQWVLVGVLEGILPGKLAEKKQELNSEEESFLLNETAAVLSSLGKHNEAASYYRQALDIDRSVHGEMHPDMARDMNNLGTALRASGKHKEAAAFYGNALAITGKIQGEPNPVWLGTLLNNLGASRYDLGDYPGAIELYEKALAIWQNEYGEKHWRTADTLSNLGTARHDSGDYEKAVADYRQALSIYREVYGEMHPDTARVLNNLGAAWYHKMEYPKAIDYYERALHTWKRIYGESHPYIAAALNKLGQTLNMEDRPGEALGLLGSALEISKSVSGDNHPDTAAVLENLGTSYRFLGKNEKALEFYEQALSINQPVLGETHPGVAGNLGNLGKTYFALGQMEKAGEYFEAAYTIFKEMVGEEHTYTKAMADWLAKVKEAAA